VSSLIPCYKEITTSDANTMLNECLTILIRTCLSLGKIQQAQSCFEVTIVEPFLQSKLSEVAKTEELMVFDTIVEFLRLKCLPIHKITAPIIKGKANNFLIDSWKKIIEFLFADYQLLFHVSSPPKFHSIFNKSLNMIANFEAMCDVSDIDVFRNSDIYRDYSKRWQLGVYFQLLHNEYASSIEMAMADGQSYTTGDVNNCRLPATNCLLTKLNAMWDKESFIFQIGHRFWKTTLLV
jgi:hypothetical protein